ncbi:hypothetical protein E2I00_010964 [Balaenoptera physalus]|uniref:Tetraspanin n=1 Tax=Balaenoptera physalus TaxID=9770 RepID=A0A643C374_BALPH|nr:hypothetical protein E2I00_010964 [Balaenoptera physalus]
MGVGVETGLSKALLVAVQSSPGDSPSSPSMCRPAILAAQPSGRLTEVALGWRPLVWLLWKAAGAVPGVGSGPVDVSFLVRVLSVVVIVATLVTTIAVTIPAFPTLSGHSFPSLSAANLVIAIGTIVMVTGFLGCLGAIKENRCLLLSFFIVLLVILLAELILITLFFVYMDKVSLPGREGAYGISSPLGVGLGSRRKSSDSSYL